MKPLHLGIIQFSLLFFLCSLLIFSCANPLITQIAEPKTVTFDTNGGSQIEDQIVYRNYPILRPDNPSKNNYTFDNWYGENENFETPWDFSTIPKTDITLYANWTPIYIDPNTADITLSQGQIIGGDPIITGSLQITVSRGATNPVTFHITIESPELYSHFKWEIAGVGTHADIAFVQEGASMSSFIIDGENTIYNTIGGHILKLTVIRADNGLKYQVNIPFIITD